MRHSLRDRQSYAWSLAATLALLAGACSESEGPEGVAGFGGVPGAGGSAGTGALGGSGGSGALGGSGGSGAGGTGSGGTGLGGSGGSAGGGGSAGTDAGPQPVANARYAYVGSGSNAIYVFTIDDATGALTPLGTPLPVNPNPSFLAFTPDGRYLLAVNEGDNVDNANAGAVSSFAINPQSGAISFINRVPSGGTGPAHVSSARSGNFAFVANYNGGTAAVFPLSVNGTLSAAVDTETFGGGAQTHQILVDVTNTFVFVVNKGLSNIAQFDFDAATGALTANTPATVALANQAGTRHMAFHPSAPFAYAINELDDTVVTLSYNATEGTLASLQTLSSLPAGANGGNNTGAEIVVAPSGNFVYASNRGDDSIAIFAVDPTTRQLSLVDHQATGGATPRSFTLEASGRRMLVANQGANEVVSFSVDTATGLLTETSTVSVPSPQFVGTYPPGGS
ncbi:MAG: lactonase family protein [Polyangiaceae bacterium]